MGTQNKAQAVQPGPGSAGRRIFSNILPPGIETIFNKLAHDFDIYFHCFFFSFHLFDPLVTLQVSEEEHVYNLGCRHGT